MRLRRALFAAATGVLLTLTGCTSFAHTVTAGATRSAASSTPTLAPPAPIAWKDCTGQIQPLIAGQPGSDRQLTFQCGRTDVPISYAEPRGATLPLFLVRARLAGQTNRIGSLVMNPGGPGASGAEAAIGLAIKLPPDVLQRFDLVGFDPRGVGLSTPVDCIPTALKDQMVASEPRPTSDQQISAAFDLAKKVAQGCTDKYGSALSTFNTENTARDLDRIRQSLGDEKITYLGYSYGTTLGSVYAHLFPTHVRAMVLDGAVDPDASQQDQAEARAAGLEKSFDAFAQNCTGLASGCPVGANPRQFVQDLLTQAAQNPIPSAKAGETRKATDGVVLAAVESALYDAASWPQLAQGLAAAQKGDSQGLFALADSFSGRLDDGKYSNFLDALNTIGCADTPLKQEVSDGEIRRLAGDWNQKYPLFGAGFAVGLYTCNPWDMPRTQLPKPDAKGSPPIVVVGNSGDPVTPLPGAVDMARDLTTGRLLTWQGQGHTSYPKDQCVIDNVDAYLINLTPPSDGLTCPAS